MNSGAVWVGGGIGPPRVEGFSGSERAGVPTNRN